MDRPKVSTQPKEGKTVLFTSLSVVPDSKLSEARLQISQEMLQSIAREAARNPSTDETMTQRLMHSSKYQTSDTRDGRRTGSHIKKEQKAHHQSLRPGTLVLLKN